MSALDHKHWDSLNFLEKWKPDGPWVLTSISTDKTSILTRTFRIKDECKKWLAEQHQGQRNLYFHVNSVRRDLNLKANREDIASLDWLHVDIDPRPGEDLEEERERALALLQDPPKGVPRPTAVIFSGGGYQGFWKLSEPLQIDGEVEKYEDAKRYNQQLELLFGADACHNVDRIMRIPGTINWPDRKKKEKGRLPTLAKLVCFHTFLEYPISSFIQAPIVQTQDNAFSGVRPNIQVSDNVKRFDEVHDIKELEDRYKLQQVIVHGCDPDDPSKWPSRSEMLFWVVCDMVRAGCDDDTIFSVITDPGFKISESVLDKRAGAQVYALRQIQQAREHAIDPWLMKMNAKHAVISDIGGKCRVTSEVPDHALGRTRLSFQSFTDFMNRYNNRRVVVGQDKEGQDVTVPLGKWWLSNESRRQYETITFAPGRELEDTYNLWRGFACEARPGKCSRFLSHLKEVVCKGSEEWYEYLMNWMARAVQQPDSPGQVAIVMRGGRGSGKSTVPRVFGKLFGRHYLQVTDPKHIVGSFNAHLRDCSVLFGDEAFYAGDKKHEGTLKGLITEELIAIESKGVDVAPGPNFLHIFLASNEDWVIPAGLDERRFFVLEVGSSHQGDKRYFDRIWEEQNNGGREALLHTLLTRDIRDFNVFKVPFTEALRMQKEFSLTAEQEWWFHKLKEGKMLPDSLCWDEDVSYDLLFADYVSSLRLSGGLTTRGAKTKFGHFLSKVCGGKMPRRVRRMEAISMRFPDGRDGYIKRPEYFIMPSLGVLREVWDSKFGGPYSWPDDAQEETPRMEAEPF